MGNFWQQLVSQFVGLSTNPRIWQPSFTRLWVTTLVLIPGGSIYLLQTAPDAPHVIGLVLIVFSLCTFGFSLSGGRLTDAVPRSILTLMVAAFLLAGIALQAGPDMEALIHSFLQSVTLNQIAIFTLVTGSLVCLSSSENWVEQIILSLLALCCALLQSQFGIVALQKSFLQVSANLAQTLNPFLIGTLVVLALLALFRISQPFHNWSRFALFLVAAIFTPIQYTFILQELQHFLASNNLSAMMLVILSFVCVWVPVVWALLAWWIHRPSVNRITLAVVALVVAMMFAYQGQQIAFTLFPGRAYHLSAHILDVETFSQLVGPTLLLVACLGLFPLSQSSFRVLDHIALLVGSLICARLDDAFWQVQSAPLSVGMDQSALSQNFTILGGRLPALAIYALLLALPLVLLALAFIYFRRSSYPQAWIDTWLKLLQGSLVVMERLLTLALVIIAFVLQMFAGTLKLVFSSGPGKLFASHPPDYLNLFVLLLLLILAFVGLSLLGRLLSSRSPGELGGSERFALALVALSCLVLIGQHPDLVHLPLLGSKIQLTGNILYWQGWLISTLFLVGLLIPPLLAILWIRRSYFIRYRELLGLAFLLVIACTILQFLWWPLLLPGLIVFIASVLLLIQIERVGVP